MGFKNWETPEGYFNSLDARFGFTLDAAASDRNRLCPTWCTEAGTFAEGDCKPVSAKDGLKFNWAGYRVWCNPPYDNSLGRWVSKALAREAEVAVLLLPPSVDTAWFQQLWALRNEPWLDLDFPAGRLKFYHPALKPLMALAHYDLIGEDIFDYSLLHVVGPAPRAGNLLVVVKQ